MTTMKEATREFLAEKNIAVVGVSRDKNKTGNLIYRKLRAEGYKVVPVNAHATSVEGDTCYQNLRTIPEKPGAVVIVTKPEMSNAVVKECADLGISKVWMHRGIDGKGTSVSHDAVKFCHEHGIQVIPGGCPMMYCKHGDMGHRVIRWLQGVTGALPKEV